MKNFDHVLNVEDVYTIITVMFGNVLIATIQKRISRHIKKELLDMGNSFL